jgi:hypothetical protein
MKTSETLSSEPIFNSKEKKPLVTPEVFLSEIMSNEIRQKATQIQLIQNDVNNLLKGFALGQGLNPEEWYLDQELTKLLKKNQ